MPRPPTPHGHGEYELLRSQHLSAEEVAFMLRQPAYTRRCLLFPELQVVRAFERSLQHHSISTEPARLLQPPVGAQWEEGYLLAASDGSCLNPLDAPLARASWGGDVWPRSRIWVVRYTSWHCAI